jgi:hypothetical protein
MKPIHYQETAKDSDRTCATCMHRTQVNGNRSLCGLDEVLHQRSFTDDVFHAEWDLLGSGQAFDFNEYAKSWAEKRIVNLYGTCDRHEQKRYS